jgi:hypothetical protein
VKEMKLSLCAALALLFGAGCGADVDPIEEIKTLRVLGVRKSLPYAKPGDEVELEMLWSDGRPEAQRSPVQVTWFSGCFNPPGDQYFGCYPQLAELDVQSCLTGTGGLRCGLGDRFSLRMETPDGSPLLRPQTKPDLLPYGLAVVFFAACGGRLAPATDPNAFPLDCVDPQGKSLGPDGFVAGYSTIYAYESLTNANPVIGGLDVAGQAAQNACIDDACLTPPAADPRCGDAGVVCVKACDKDGSTTDCPEIPLKPRLDRSIVEKDTVVSGDYDEQIWVSYLVDRGGIREPLRLVNDGVKGWNEDFGTAIFAPREPGPLTVWALVRDNRGGVGWTRATLVVTP